MNNTQRITLASFFAYFVMSGVLAPIGIVAGPMAEFLGLQITEATAKFGWLTIGNLAGGALALFIFNLFELKTVMLVIYTLIAGCLLAMLALSGLAAIGVVLGIVGVCCGLGLAGAALVISRTYETERRASMLVITDGAFSVAGFVCAAFATFFVARAYHWSSVYQFVALVALAIVVLVATSRLPVTAQPAGTGHGPRERWPLRFWACIAALLLYTLGQYSMLWWLPNYAETALGASKQQAGELVSLFWVGMFIAQIGVAWGVLRLGVRRLMRTAAVAVTAFSIPLWAYGEISNLWLFALLWGVANLGLLKIVISFATQTVRVPTPGLVSSLLLGASTGTAVSPWVTSQIVAQTDNHFILQFSTACYLMLTLLLFAASRGRV